MITRQKAFGERWTLSLSDLDGSQRRLLADSDLMVSSPTWSPDGKWLIVSVAAGEPDATVGALVKLEDCQIFALPYFRGNVLAWGR